MAGLEGQIRELRHYVDVLSGTHPPRVVDCPGGSRTAAAGLPFAVGPGSSPGFLLRSDTFIELGNPTAGSCAGVLWTDDTSLVVDGRTTIFGPDVPESEGGSLPFAQVMVVAGPELSDADHPVLQQSKHVGDAIEGYMVKSTSEHVWSRVGKDVAAKGFDLAGLGAALMHLLALEVPRATVSEVVFVTTSKEDVARMRPILVRARERGSELIKEVWRAQGFEVDCTLDCSSCHDQVVCDDVREVIAETKKVKVQGRR